MDRVLLELLYCSLSVMPMRIGGDLEFIRIDDVVQMCAFVDFYQTVMPTQKMY
jgi:hypothetical protein